MACRQPCDPAVPYAADTDVSAALTGLSPATTYHYRLTGTTPTALRAPRMTTFVTDPDVPAIVSQTVADRGSDHAASTRPSRSWAPSDGADRVRHDIVLRGSDAGGRQAVAATSGPTDQDAKPVSIELSGLTPETTYHYRVVATNSAGTTDGADGVFHTHALPEGLPDGRHYELVTRGRQGGPSGRARLCAGHR